MYVVLSVARSLFYLLLDGDVGFPRRSICQALVILVAQHPKVSRDAVAVLLEVGDAIQASASDAEQDLFLNSTLSQEVFVRNACLQAMQVC